jgi:hypothetical protein
MHEVKVRTTLRIASAAPESISLAEARLMQQTRRDEEARPRKEGSTPGLRKCRIV